MLLLYTLHITDTHIYNVLSYIHYILQIHTYIMCLAIYSMGHKKVPVFRNTLPCNGNFAFRVRFPVPFYNFPCFYCCVSILKVRRKERLKNGKKNGAKTVQRSVFFPLRFFLTIVHLCLYLDKNFEIPR